MLRATHLGGYMKNGNKMYTYAVSGPIAEIEEYLIIQEKQSGRAHGTWNKTPDGKPLYYLNVTNEMRNGRMPQPTLDLIPSFDKSRIIVDTTRQELADFNEITNLTRHEQARIAAEIRMGVREPIRTSRGFATVATAQAPAGAITAPLGEEKDLADKLMQLAGAGGDGTEGLGGGVQQD